MKASRETWILNGLLVTQDESRSVKAGCLRIVDGAIAEIRARTPSKIPTGAKRIDAAGLVVMPGLVQAHVHLCQTLFRNLADDRELLSWLRDRIWPYEAAHTEETLYLSALAGIRECLSTGTTALLDMATVRHTEAVLQAAEDTGIRASIGKCLMDHPETTPPTLRETATRALDEASRLHREWDGRAGGRLQVSYAPRFAVSCTEDLLRRVGALARDQGALIHTHASENRAEVELVRRLTGRENLAYLHHVGLTASRLVVAHGIWLSEAEKRLIFETGTHIAHCPGSNLKLASGIAPVPELLKLGVNVALGCDGAPCNNSLDAFQELRLAALVHKPAGGPTALRAQEALDLATLGGARALGLEKQIGSIAVGKRADLIGVDLLDPSGLAPASSGLRPGLAPGPTRDVEGLVSALVYAGTGSRVRWTLVDGKTLFERRPDGRERFALRSLDRATLLPKLHHAQERVVRKAGVPTSGSDKFK
ncbi:MAG: 5'-deoxyadenosine deaminase [Bdellovibrionales bacterium]|nr:5'-deoxyadenosine deaminase [Bdellovibrionales bacterium]